MQYVTREDKRAIAEYLAEQGARNALAKSKYPRNWDERIAKAEASAQAKTINLWSLSESEWQEYIALVNAFCRAKLSKNYAASDALRKQLTEWQSGKEQLFLDMYKSGRYLWSYWWELDQHRADRMARRN